MKPWVAPVAAAVFGIACAVATLHYIPRNTPESKPAVRVEMHPWGLRNYDSASHFLQQDVVVREQTSRVLQQGDTFWQLAKDYGVSVEQLQAANPGMTAERLQVGHNVMIPQLNAQKGDLIITTPSSMSIDDYSQEYRRLGARFRPSPIYTESEQRGIDPRFVYAVFRKECSLGCSDEWWHKATCNPANLRGSGPMGTTEDGFAMYPTDDDGIEAYLNHVEKHVKAGRVTAEAIIKWDAPASENDTAEYIRFIRQLYGEK
ncbi:LysM peptidoglycan-binding domain-containing protein [Candidatus Woesearchaeota archaeon]|nr:LysM peptidoglycan-binding domain-containing protein [Candidatus Woesearchaeota archaeon]